MHRRPPRILLAPPESCLVNRIGGVRRIVTGLCPPRMAAARRGEEKSPMPVDANKARCSCRACLAVARGNRKSQTKLGQGSRSPDGTETWPSLVTRRDRSRPLDRVSVKDLPLGRSGKIRMPKPEMDRCRSMAYDCRSVRYGTADEMTKKSAATSLGNTMKVISDRWSPEWPI